MKLEVARLCLDCDEIHEEQICPTCGSEAFAFLTRWVKTSGEPRIERRPGPAAQQPVGQHAVTQQAVTHQARTPEQIEAIRQLIEGKPERASSRSLLTGGVAGLAAVSLLGWAWRATSKKSQTDGTTPPKPRDAA